MNDSKRCRFGRPAVNGLSLIVLILVSGCTPLTPNWDANFGESVKLSAAQQTINPGASRNTDPVSGLDGRSANEVVGRYYKSFQEPPPPPPLFQVMTGGAE